MLKQIKWVTSFAIQFADSNDVNISIYLPVFSALIM